MEKFKSYLSNDVDFNIDLYNKIQDLKDMRQQQKTEFSDLVIYCKLKIDFISLNDSDLELSTFIQSNFPCLDRTIRMYAKDVLEKEANLKNFTIQCEQILPEIEIINGYFLGSLNIYSQKSILQNNLKQISSVTGQLILIDYFQILKIYPVESYYSIRRYSYKCGCFAESRIFNQNLISHMMQNGYSHLCGGGNGQFNQQKLPSCDQCHHEMTEDKDKNKMELCQKLLVYIPGVKDSNCFKRNDGNTKIGINSNKKYQEGKLVEMYIEKQNCNKLVLNQTYSCIAYYAISAIPKLAKSTLLSGFKPLEITEKLFACTISTNLKAKNLQFNQQMISQVNFITTMAENESNSMKNQQQNSQKFNSNEDDTNFHFKFKQLMFGVDSFFNETITNKFSFLHLKTSIVLSYILSHSKEFTSNLPLQHSEQLNILFKCESNFVENISNTIISSFAHLENVHVFDCLLESDLSSALVKSNNGIIIIKNFQDVSKQHSELFQSLLSNQETLVESLKVKLHLKVTVWAIFTIIESSTRINKFQNNKGPSFSLNSFEQLFDVCLEHSKSTLSVKDYNVSLSNEAELFLKKELSRHSKKSSQSFKSAQEMSTAKKSQQQKTNPSFVEEISTLKKQYQDGYRQNQFDQNKVEQNEEQAYELLNGFINTIRSSNNNSEQNSYSTNNIASLSKFAIASSLFRNVFIKQNSVEHYIMSDKSDDRPRVVIDIFDAFVSVFFNVLSRKIFSKELDIKYFLSFIINYGLSYVENSEMVSILYSLLFLYLFNIIENRLSLRKKNSLQHQKKFKIPLLNLSLFEDSI